MRTQRLFILSRDCLLTSMSQVLFFKGELHLFLIVPLLLLDVEDNTLGPDLFHSIHTLLIIFNFLFNTDFVPCLELG